MLFRGSGVALITPFDEYNHIHFSKLEELIDFHLQNHTDAIIVCGTTAESATLSTDEKKELISFVTKKVNHKIPVIAGTGTNDTKRTIEMSKYAQNVGCDGLLIVTPYYNKCTQEGLYQHYFSIASQTDLPILLYHVPSRTGVHIAVDTIIRLSHIQNIVGIKEASSDISQITEIASKTDKNFAIYSGNDNQILPILSLGGAGVISVFANLYPKEVHELCHLFFENNLQKARKMQFQYLDIINSLFLEVNPIPIKEAMNLLGKNVGNCRLPLCNMSEENKNKLKNSLKEISS